MLATTNGYHFRLICSTHRLGGWEATGGQIGPALRLRKHKQIPEEVKEASGEKEGGTDSLSCSHFTDQDTLRHLHPTISQLNSLKKLIGSPNVVN